MVIRIGLEWIPPFLSSGIRFIVASLLIFLIMKVKKIKLSADKTSWYLYLFITIFAYSLPFGLVYWGEQYIPSGLTSIIFGAYPFFAAIFSHFALADEKTGREKIIGMVLGLSGLAVIFSENLSLGYNINLLAISAIFLSSLVQAIVAVGIKKYGQNLHPLSMNLVPMFISGIILLIFGAAFEDTEKVVFNITSISSILFLAVFGSVIAFTSYFWLLKRTSVVILSMTSFITPVFAVIAGWLFIGEKLSGRHLAGSLLVLLGILFANLGGFFLLTLKNRFNFLFTTKTNSD
jgi:drug/metabolite transporter (DMT)-like permease